MWICNVYLPPNGNLKKRGVDEDSARGLVEDITTSIPTDAKSVVCGDWNTRIGDLYPKVGD